MTVLTHVTAPVHVPCPQYLNNVHCRGGRQDGRQCFTCGEVGHIKKFCPHKKVKVQQQNAPRVLHAPVAVQTTYCHPASPSGGAEVAAPTAGSAMHRVCSDSTMSTRTSSWASLDSYGSTDVAEVSPVIPQPLSQTDERGYLVVTPGLVLNGRYRVVQQLGKGTFATVVSAEDMHSQGMVAIKVIRAERSALEDAEDEIHIMREINSFFSRSRDAASGLVLLLDTFTFEKHTCLVEPLYGESLYNDLRTGGFSGLPLADVMSLGQSMIRAVGKLHMMGLVHCDLKPENILRTQAGSSHATVVDYGCSYRDTDPKPRLIQTLYYRAPEVVLGGYWSFPVDMWSIGCIMFELLTGQPLFRVEGDTLHPHVFEDVLESQIPLHMQKSAESSRADHVPLPSMRSQLAAYNVPLEVIEFMSELLCIDPAQRMRAHQAAYHPIFEAY